MADIAHLAAAPGQQEITEVLKLLQAASEELISQRRRAYGWAKGLLQGPLGREPRSREALTVLRRLAYLLQATLEKYDRNVQALVKEHRG